MQKSLFQLFYTSPIFHSSQRRKTVNLRAKHVSFSVIGCSDQHKTLHKTPVSEDLRREWIKFIFDGEVPATVGINLSVCAKHFDMDCFHNLGQYNAGLRANLFLKKRSIPTVRGERTDDVSVLCVSFVRLPQANANR